MTKSSKNFFAVTILVAVVLALFATNFFTFCWSDEALYLAHAHRLFMGQSLVVDEWHPTQFYIPLLFPFYCAFVKITGSTDGIYLAARLLAIFIHCCVGAALYASLKKMKWQTFLSLSASVLFMLFCKSNVLGPSYYSISLDFFMAGILLILNFKKNLTFFFAGISFAISILANPFSAVIYIGYSIFYFAKAIKFRQNFSQTFRALAAIWAGSFVVAVAYFSFLLSRASVFEIAKNLHYVFLDPTHGGVNYAYRTLKYFRYVLTSWPATIPLFFLSAVFVIAKKIKNKEISEKEKKILVVLNFALFFASVPFCKKFAACLATPFFLAFVLHLLKNENFAKDFFSGDEIKFFILPGFFLSMIYQWSSDTNISAMVVGFAATIPGTLFVIFDFSKNFFKNKKIVFALNFFVAFALIFTLSAQRFANPYRDSNIARCTKKIEQGPAKGLFTTVERKTMYDEICSEMNSLSAKNDESIFISPMMPWAYLMFRGKYGAFQTWRTPLSDKRLFEYYQTTSHALPTYVILLDEKYALSSKKESKDFRGWFYDEILLKRYEKKPIPLGTLFTISPSRENDPPQNSPQ